MQGLTTDDRLLTDLTQEVVGTYQRLQSQDPALVEAEYIVEAQQLEGYGVEYHNAKVIQTQQAQVVGSHSLTCYEAYL